VIVLTTLSLALTGLASLVLAKIHKDSGADAASQWNTTLEIALTVMYTLANIWIFVPPCMEQLKGAGRLSKYTRLPGSASDAADNALPLTVAKGSDYYTLEQLKRGTIWEVDAKNTN